MRKGSRVRKAMLLTGENIHDDSEVQESRPQARPGRMTLLFLGKEVCVCSQVCVRVSVHSRMRLCVCVRVCTCMNLLHVGVHVSALGSMGRVRNNDDDDTGMITALLKVLSCALCWAPF